MDVDDLFDTPKVRLKASTSPKPAPTPAPSDEIAEAIADMDPDDGPYPGGGGDDDLKTEAPRPESTELEPDLATCARAAAEAHDAFAEAKAALDVEADKLRRHTDEQLKDLTAKVKNALRAKGEAEEALLKAMKREEITTIPMTDRPPIKIKVKAGSKQGIKKGWLVDPENYAVKAFDAARAGHKSFEEEDGSVFVVPQSGKDFATGLWEAQPKSEATERVEVPDAYEDEPDHG